LKYLANVGENTYHISLDDQDTRIDLDINGEPLQIDLVPINGDHTYSLLINGRSYVAIMMDMDESCQVMIDGRVYAVDVEEEELARLRSQVVIKMNLFTLD